MRITNTPAMVNKINSSDRKLDARLALLAVLAGAGLAVSGCNKAGTDASAETPRAVATAPADGETVQFATATEAADFARLPETVRAEIRAKYEACVADGRDFAAEEETPELREYEFQSWVDSCDSSRASQIRGAISDKNVEEMITEITSAG